MSVGSAPSASGRPPATVLIVGASGFVGRALCHHLLERGYRVVAASRESLELPLGVHHRPLGDLGQPQDWSALLAGVDHVVYLAARVHVMNDTHPEPLEAYRAINLRAPLALAGAAAHQGVRRFVYLSSVKVNGEESRAPLTERDPPAPSDPYGVSKWEAEEQLLRLGHAGGLEVVVVRPPLVYGPGVRANFLQLARAVRRGLPLPLGGITNRRSMVYVGNLVDAIRFVLEAPGLGGETFFVSDGQDLSTPDLVRTLASATGHPARLLPVPAAWLDRLGHLGGRQAVVRRLTGSLQVDSGKLRALGWSPPFTPQEGLRITVRAMSAAPPPRVPGRLTARQRVYLLLRGGVERLLAGALLLPLLPLLALIAAAIRLSSPGPALFVQERAGRNHRPFRIYKFRTMWAGTPQLSTEDMRRSGRCTVTPLGRWLRRTSLDELPQLLNVLRGEMSFVGPRPALLTQEEVLRRREALGVHRLPPGITGLAQVTGRDDLSDEEKVDRDARYLRHLGPGTDLLLVAWTFRSLVGGDGTY